nr:hypothetical protein [Fredinandcohnia onubensis]
MNKFKLTIFILIIAITILFLGYPYVKNMTDNNAPTTIELVKGNYKVGEDISPGNYDIDVIEGDLTFIQRQLSHNDKILGITLNRGENISLDGEGKVKLTPANFNKLEEIKTNEFHITHSGFYKVDEQLPEGEYLVTYTGLKEENEKPFIQVLSSKKDVLKSYQFEKSDSHTIQVKKDQILEVNKFLFVEAKELTIILKKL